MIFTSLRLEFSSQTLESKTLQCNDQDFENAIFIVESLLDHLASVFSLMPGTDKQNTQSTLLPIINVLLQQLPSQFTRTQIMPIVETLGIPSSTAYRYLNTLIEHNKIKRLKYNSYEKN